MYTSGFAQEVVVHKSQIIEISDSIPAASASLLSCGVITGIGAVVNAAALRPGEDVVVIGAGGVGLNTIQGARIAGARRIVAVDVSDEKLQAAKDFGATDIVRADQDAPWETAIAAMGKGADCVFVTVGITPVYAAAPNYIGARGRVIAVGMPPSDQTTPYSPDMLAANGQVIVGSKMGDVVLRRDIPWLVDLYEQGRLQLDALVSKTYTLEQINEAIADVKAGAARRNVIVFD
ncbi:MAG: zinc-binding dehydrogenase [Pseudomonadota bacterium]